MITKIITSFLEYYQKVRARTDRLIKIIKPEHLDFQYKEGKFTLADHIRHIAVIERYMFAEIIAGRKNLYVGCGKDLADGYEDVVSFFHELHYQTLDIISKLTDEDLDKNCVTPSGIEVKVAKWLQLLAEHEIHHRAQMYIYLNMLDVQTPPIYGLTSEELNILSNNSVIK